MKQKKINGLVILQSKLLFSYPEIIHGISTRKGGVSKGPYRSLNVSFTVGDEPCRVQENRIRLCRALGVSLKNLTLGKQVHSSKVRIVGAIHELPLRATDALLTNKPGITLMAISADCPLVICYDPIKKAIGMIHASWRGVAEEIITKTIRRMKQEFGSRPTHLLTVVSPSIGPCCYEVKQDFVDAVTALLPYSQKSIIRQRSKISFNLWKFVREQLLRSGVKPKNIESNNLCTKCHHELFYSFRRDGVKTGRFGALVSLA